jgi:hypothetical protein
MKTFLAIWMAATAAFVWAGEIPAAAQRAGAVVKGRVLEVKDVESYTYLRLKTEEGETWAAVGKAPVKSGDQVTIENVMVMKDFESKTQKKTFSTIIFGTLSGASGVGDDLAAVHRGVATATDAEEVRVSKASGANAQTVEEIVTRRTELKDQSVLVRGKVVKFSPGIMGKNWVHLRDGTGSGANGTNDLLVTTTGLAKIGSVVTAKGFVRTDKDFGSGYAYKVLIEEAMLQP